MTKRCRLIGTDPGANFGWAAISEDGDYIDGGTNAIKLRSKDPKAKKWLGFDQWFSALLDAHKPDAVAVEDVRRHVGTLAAHAYGYYRYTIEARCLERGIQCIALGVGEWKKIAAGLGSSKKSTVADVLHERYQSVMFETLDHSDSLGIAVAGLHVLNNPEAAPVKKKKKAKQPQS